MEGKKKLNLTEIIQGMTRMYLEKKNVLQNQRKNFTRKSHT